MSMLRHWFSNERWGGGGVYNMSMLSHWFSNERWGGGGGGS